MNAIQALLTEHIGIWTDADTEKKTGRGRSSGNAASVYGIRKLRELILELAVRGKLVPQDLNDEPASVLLKRIQAEKTKLIAAGKIKKDKPLPPITEDEIPFKLPNGWVWTRFGEITNFGVTEKLGFISDETWVLDLEDIEKDTSKLLQKFRFSERRSLSDKNSFQAGDVLYGKLRPYLNKVVVADEAGVCTTEILPFRCYGPFDSHYFKGALKSPYFINYVNARSYGMKMPRLGTEDGRKACFPLPPLAEQHRIVAKVDELMTLCDQLETRHNNAAEAHEKLVSHLLATLTQSQNSAGFSANWPRIAAHFNTLFTTEASIDALKQTLLQLAVMGKLVPQDPNDEPASALLKRIQAEKARLIAEGKIKKDKSLPKIAEDEKPFSLPQDWVWVRLGEVLNKITDGTHHSPTNTPTGDFKYISAKNIKPWGLDLVDVTYVTTDVHQEIYSRCDPELGDVLYIKDGATTGIGTINPLAEPFSMLSSVALLKPSLGIKNTYLLNTMVAPLFYDEMRAGMTGVAITRVTLSKLNDAIIPLPPLAEQHRIVAKVDELMALCDQLKTRITLANQLQQKLADVVVEQAAPRIKMLFTARESRTPDYYGGGAQ